MQLDRNILFFRNIYIQKKNMDLLQMINSGKNVRLIKTEGTRFRNGRLCGLNL